MKGLSGYFFKGEDEDKAFALAEEKNAKLGKEIWVVVKLGDSLFVVTQQHLKEFNKNATD